MKRLVRAVVVLLCLAALLTSLHCTTTEETPGDATPSDTTSPVISSVNASDFTTSSVTIGWLSDENATSQVEYGTTSSYGSSSALDSNLVTTHSVSLTGLTAGTTYHYRVNSRDAAGNESASGDYMLGVCSIIGPTVSNLAVFEITGTSAKITWTTDYPSTSQVEYGPASYRITTSPLDSTLVISHSLTLAGLIQGTYYYYKVKSKDACGNEGCSTAWENFVTPAQQNLKVGQSAQNANQRVTLKWAVRTEEYYWLQGWGDAGRYLAPPGEIFIIISAEVVNLGIEDFFAHQGYFSVIDSLGNKYGTKPMYLRDAFVQAHLWTGEWTSGKIAFSVPIDATGLVLAYDLGNDLSGPMPATWVL